MLLSRLTARLSITLTAACGIAQAAPVLDTTTGREWRQLTETASLSWTQIATVCDPASGACSGSVGTIDFSGWTLASVLDIHQLFTDFGVVGFSGSTPVVSSPADVSAIFSEFSPTIVDSDHRSIAGWSRTTVSATQARLPYVYDWFSPAFSDFGNSAFNSTMANSSLNYGVWLFRDSNVVPEPSPLVLLVLAGLGLFAAARRTV